MSLSNFLLGAGSVFENNIVSITLLLALVFATYTDVKYLKIYDKFNLTLLFIRGIFIFVPWYNLPFSLSSLLSSITVFIFMLTMAVIFMHKMGGDIKFISVFMLFFNFEYMLVFMSISSILSLIYSICLRFYFKKLKNKKAKAFDEKTNFIIKLQHYFVKFFIVKHPSIEEFASITDKEFKKFKMPFAPFFLMAYIVTFLIYKLMII